MGYFFLEMVPARGGTNRNAHVIYRNDPALVAICANFGRWGVFCGLYSGVFFARIATNIGPWQYQPSQIGPKYRTVQHCHILMVPSFPAGSIIVLVIGLESVLSGASPTRRDESVDSDIYRRRQLQFAISNPHIKELMRRMGGGGGPGLRI